MMPRKKVSPKLCSKVLKRQFCRRFCFKELTTTEQHFRKLENRMEELEETVEIMSDKELLRGIERGLKDLKEGRYKKCKDVKAMFSDL